jgi:hypothetical protein
MLPIGCDGGLAIRVLTEMIAAKGSDCGRL